MGDVKSSMSYSLHGSGDDSGEVAAAPSTARRHVADTITLMEAWRAWAERMREHGNRVWGADGRQVAQSTPGLTEDES